MALVKASGLIFMRKLIHSKGEVVADRFWKILSKEDREFIKTLIPTYKLPIEEVTRFYELAVPIIFPEKSLAQGLWQLGYENAQNDMKGIYRAFLKIATLGREETYSVEMLIRQAAVIWKTYHAQGEASVRRLGAKQFMFIVENYPGIPKSFREDLTGYIAGLLNLTGAKKVKVVQDDVDPNAWKWLIIIE